MGRAVVSGLCTLVLAPAILLAQSGDLRAQIRADIMQDPRAAEMSEAEVNALVEAIAIEAEQTGAAGDYLEAKNSFQYETLFEPPQEPSKIMQILLSPIVIATLLLLLILGGVIYYIVRRGKTPVPTDLV